MSNGLSAVNDSASNEVADDVSACAFELRLVNGFRLLQGGRDVVLPVCGQRLVAYLGLVARPTRPAVAGTLWPDASESHASASLRSALWRVNSISPGVVRAEHSTLSLSSAANIDITKLRACIRSALTCEPGDEIDLLSADLNGDLLPGWDEEWILLEREHLRLLRLRAVEATSDHLRRQGRLGAALLAVYSVIKEEPLRESAQRLAVQIHIEDGNLADAANQVQQYAETLQRELGISPSPAMLAMLSEARVRRSPADATRVEHRGEDVTRA